MICVNWERSLSINFIDIKKAFDSIQRFALEHPPPVRCPAKIHLNLQVTLLPPQLLHQDEHGPHRSLHHWDWCQARTHPLALPVPNGPQLHHEESPGQARCRHHLGRDQLTYRPWFCRWLVEDGHHLQHPTSNLAGKSWTLHQCRKIKNHAH